MSQQSQITSTSETPVRTPAASNPGTTQSTLTAKTNPSTPAPVWTRYIDSRLKQFCVR